MILELTAKEESHRGVMLHFDGPAGGYRTLVDAATAAAWPVATRVIVPELAELRLAPAEDEPGVELVDEEG